MRMQVEGYSGPVVDEGAVSERGRGAHGPETRRRRGGQGLIRSVDSGGRVHEGGRGLITVRQFRQVNLRLRARSREAV